LAGDGKDGDDGDDGDDGEDGDDGDDNSLGASKEPGATAAFSDRTKDASSGICIRNTSKGLL
jgi:hypothetical protein